MTTLAAARSAVLWAIDGMVVVLIGIEWLMIR
jgi:hypothetical protein